MSMFPWRWGGAGGSTGDDPLATLQIKPLSAEIAACGQVRPEHIPAIAAAGYKALLCNRPDGESADQPMFRDIANAAEAHGLRVALVPVVSGRISEQDAEQMLATVEELPKPILAYCRSGARSAMLWRLAEAL